MIGNGFEPAGGTEDGVNARSEWSLYGHSLEADVTAAMKSSYEIEPFSFGSFGSLPAWHAGGQRFDPV